MGRKNLYPQGSLSQQLGSVPHRGAEPACLWLFDPRGHTGVPLLTPLLATQRCTHGSSHPPILGALNDHLPGCEGGSLAEGAPQSPTLPSCSLGQGACPQQALASPPPHPVLRLFLERAEPAPLLNPRIWHSKTRPGVFPTVGTGAKKRDPCQPQGSAGPEVQASELVQAPGPLSTHLPPLPPAPRCPALAELSLTATLLLQNPPAGPWGWRCSSRAGTLIPLPPPP